MSYCASGGAWLTLKNNLTPTDVDYVQNLFEEAGLIIRDSRKTLLPDQKILSLYFEYAKWNEDQVIKALKKSKTLLEKGELHLTGEDDQIWGYELKDDGWHYLDTKIHYIDSGLIPD